MLNPNQLGFLEGKSILTQFLCCFDDWASPRNKSRPTDVMLLDFAKVFDSVPHERLLLKLICHGIDGSWLRWFRSFLNDRKQCYCSRHPLILVLCNVGGSPRYDPGPNFISNLPQWHIILHFFFIKDVCWRHQSTQRTVKHSKGQWSPTILCRSVSILGILMETTLYFR